MKEFSFDAVGVGDQEFIQGKSFIGQTDLPLITLCINDIDSNRSIFTNSKTFKRAGISVLMTSLISPDLFKFYPDSIRNSIEVTEPEKTWKEFKLLSSFIPDLTILISHLGYDNDVTFLGENEGIDVLLSGHSQVLLNEPEIHGETIVVAPGKNGENLGVLHLKVTKDGKIVDFTHDMILLKAEIVGESPVIRKLIYQYNDDLRKELKRKAIAGGRKFHGSDFCIGCHEEEYEDWKLTVHAGAYQTLEEMGKSEEANCIDCHTTGYGYPGGFDTIETTPDMAGVGCEECHRVPKSVAFDEGKHRVLPVIENWCTRCHREPHIVSFDFEEMLKHIDHKNE